MASGMDLAIQGASAGLDTTGVVPNSQAGLAAGTQLALQQQQVEANRQKIQFQQDQHSIMQSDWLHDQYKGIALSTTPEEAKARIAQLKLDQPKVLQTQLQPSTEKWLTGVAGKVHPAGDTILAAAYINDIMKNPSLYSGQDVDAKHQAMLQFAKETVSASGLPAGQLIDKFNELAQHKAALENQLQIGLQRDAAQSHVVTPAVADIAGKPQAEAQAIASQANPGMARNNRMLDDQAVKAGQSFELNPIIKANKISSNSLDRSISILTNKEKPVTSNDLNLAYNDYINAVAAGGVATEGKISRELPASWALDFNRLKGKAGEFDDLRQDPAGSKLIDMLTKNTAKVKSDLAQASADEANRLYGNYSYHGNPKVVQVARDKLKEFNPSEYSTRAAKGEFSQGGMPGTPESQPSQSPTPTPTPQNPAAANAMAGPTTKTPESKTAASAAETKARQTGQAALAQIKQAGGTLKVNGKIFTADDVRKNFRDTFGSEL